MKAKARIIIEMYRAKRERTKDANILKYTVQS